MIFGLIDCNNFFVSCERAFNPGLNNKPVVVLSNNDGCVIARSNEAKELGIPMAAPYFKYKAVLAKHKAAVFSSNYQLYGDMSQRVMQIVRSCVPDMEVYSIDEAFMRLDGITDVVGFSRNLRRKIYKWTGIPTSIGIAPTKTLAKIAGGVAKLNKGVFDITGHEDAILKNQLANEIWGISKGWSDRLKKVGVLTALDLKNLKQSSMGVVLNRIIYELNGISCLKLAEVTNKQNIMSSRSFGKPVTELKDLEEAVANYTARACEKLRAQNSKAQGIHVYLRTNKFSKNEGTYHNDTFIGFGKPLSDTGRIIQIANQGLRTIYKSGFIYKKAGVMLSDITSATHEQQHLFAGTQNNEKLMATLDHINQKLGDVFYLAQGTSRAWQMRSDKRSPRYTTKWNEVLVADKKHNSYQP